VLQRIWTPGSGKGKKEKIEGGPHLPIVAPAALLATCASCSLWRKEKTSSHKSSGRKRGEIRGRMERLVKAGCVGWLGRMERGGHG